MIYNEYKLSYYKNSRNRKKPVYEYIKIQDKKDRAKIFRYFELLVISEGYLNEPYSKHVIEKIRELRVDFSVNHHRIFYFTFVNKNIILLHAFLKKSGKLPEQEIKRAQENFQDLINNPESYEKAN